MAGTQQTTDQSPAPPDQSDLRAVFSDLVDEARWVVWAWVERTNEQGKKYWTKEPRQAGNPDRKASTTKPETWTTATKAIETRDAREDVAGVGVVVTGDGGLGIVDLDGCRDPETGELTEWARKIVDAFDSYAEVSPSGTGLKLYARGAPPYAPAKTVPMPESPEGVDKEPEVDVLLSRRYGTVTGHSLEDTPAEVRETPDAWNRLVRWMAEKGDQEDDGRDRVSGATEIPAAFWQVLGRDEKVRRWWTTGLDPEEDGGDRSASGHDATMACALAARGFEDAEIEAVIRAFPHGQVGSGKLRGREADRRIGRLLVLADEYRQKGTSGGAVVRALGDVEAQQVEWAWPGRVMRGAVNEVTGDPGDGKSWLTQAMATAETLGLPLPGDNGPREPGRVLLVSTEDPPETVIRPRMESMGADLSRVLLLDGFEDYRGETVPLNLSREDHWAGFEGLVQDHEPTLIIIDPITAHLGDVNSWKDSEVRSVLAPLGRLAAESRAAVLFVRHLSKGQGKAIYRPGGSIAFLGLVRSSLLVGKPDPDNEPNKRAVIRLKGNVGADPKPVSYEITERGFAWIGESDERWKPDDLMGEGGDTGRPPTAKEAALEFLEEVLDGEEWTDTRELKEHYEARPDAGFSWDTLMRATKDDLIEVERDRRDENGRQLPNRYRLVVVPGEEPF